MADSNFDAKIIEGVAIGNLKSIAEQPAMLSNLAYSNTVLNNNLANQNAVSNQHSLNELGVVVTAKSARLIEGLLPLEAKASSEFLTSSALAEQIADLKATIQSFTSQK
ncbi:MAG TPA: R body protein [Terriglobia bacterium]|nr:R body protein [Terriglobia bacterium]